MKKGALQGSKGKGKAILQQRTRRRDMLDWHKEPRSRRLLDRLNKNNVTLVKRVFFPADFYDYVGTNKEARRVLSLLENRRDRAIDRIVNSTFSLTFMEAAADGSRSAELMAILNAAPDVSAVVQEHCFGSN
jgi:hypothetical protein